MRTEAAERIANSVFEWERSDDGRTLPEAVADAAETEIKRLKYKGSDAWYAEHKARIIRKRTSRTTLIRQAEQSFIAASRRYLDALPSRKQAALDALAEAEVVLDTVLSKKQPRGKYRRAA